MWRMTKCKTQSGFDTWSIRFPTRQTQHFSPLIVDHRERERKKPKTDKDSFQTIFSRWSINCPVPVPARHRGQRRWICSKNELVSWIWLPKDKTDKLEGDSLTASHCRFVTISSHKAVKRNLFGRELVPRGQKTKAPNRFKKGLSFLQKCV